MEPKDRPTFPSGKIIENRFKVISKLGSGGFGDIYLIEDLTNHCQLALKTEYKVAKKQALINELKILKSLESAFVPHVFSSGEDDICRFYVMSIFGPSLMKCKKSTRNRFFPIHFVLLIAEETLFIIEQIHKQGIVHRDIKASNFLLRPHNRTPLCLIDFGISAFYINPKTKQVIPNERGKFVGTLKYASVNVHKKNQQTPRDDLMSWFYMIADLSMKRLPWSRTKDRDQVLRQKESATATDLCCFLPSSFCEIFMYLKSLDYGEKPNYKNIYQLIKEGREQNGTNFNGDEWKQIWGLDQIASDSVPRTDGDTKYDTFDPNNPHKNYPNTTKKSCNIS